MPFDEIKIAVRYLCNNMFFTFNDVIYKQDKESPMGSKVSPIFADFVMTDLENECLSRLDFTPVIFKRFVDDIWTVVPKNKVNSIIKIFNEYDSDLKFTFELEKNNSISFHDLLLTRVNNKIVTNWYHKPTFSGRILNYKSNHPIHEKIGVIYSLIYKAVLYSDNKKIQSDNSSLAKSILILNSYPRSFLEMYTKKRHNYL